VVTLSNVNGPFAEQIAGKLGQAAHGEQVTLPAVHKEVAVSPAILQKYVGKYQLAPTFEIAITLEEGRLISQATNQPKVPIFPESETKFFLRAVEAQLEFFKNDKGEVTHLVLHQNGRDVQGMKK